MDPLSEQLAKLLCLRPSELLNYIFSSLNLVYIVWFESILEYESCLANVSVNEAPNEGPKLKTTHTGSTIYYLGDSRDLTIDNFNINQVEINVLSLK